MKSLELQGKVYQGMMTPSQGLSCWNTQKSLEILEKPRKSLKILQNPWKSLKKFENTLKKIKIPWKSLKIFKWRTLKSIEDFSRFNLDEPRIFKARTRLGFQGISFSSQGLNIKTYQGFFKVQPWKPRIFQGKDKVRISRNLATLV